MHEGREGPAAEGGRKRKEREEEKNAGLRSGAVGEVHVQYILELAGVHALRFESESLADHLEQYLVRTAVWANQPHRERQPAVNSQHRA